jgi:cobalt-zinc-cadmium efflux system protein
MVVEVIGGILTGSLALLADAAHMLTDVTALLLTSFAMWMAAKPHTQEKTYGYHRAEILAAVVNALVLLLLSGWIFYEAYQRFHSPPEIAGLPMLAIGMMGLAMNFVSMKLLSGHAEASLNVQSAYVEVLSDAISSVGVIVAALVIWLTGWSQADPVISAGIGLFIIWRTWRLLSQAVSILMESVPSHLNVPQVAQAMTAVPGVKAIHDLHIWTITSGLEALSAHVVVDFATDRDALLMTLERLLKDRFGIEHTTLQIVDEPNVGIQVGRGS